MRGVRRHRVLLIFLTLTAGIFTAGRYLLNPLDDPFLPQRIRHHQQREEPAEPHDPDASTGTAALVSEDDYREEVPEVVTVAQTTPPSRRKEKVKDGGRKKASRWGKGGRPNGGIAGFDDEISRRLKALTSRHALAADPDVVQLLHDIIDPPPNEGALKFPWSSGGGIPTPATVKQLGDINMNKRGGFFVECGAFDGERSSNTLFLEMERGWTGLLIEPDPHYYTQLLGKNRRVWSLNACLSPYSYVTEVQFKEDTHGNGLLQVSEGMNDNQPGNPETEETAAAEEEIDVARVRNDVVEIVRTLSVACFPLESILLALARTNVDYLSLDVGGAEQEILGSIPFDRISVGVVSIDYNHVDNGMQQALQLMTSRGYHQYPVAVIPDVVQNQTVEHRQKLQQHLLQLQQHQQQLLQLQRQARQRKQPQQIQQEQQQLLQTIEQQIQQLQQQLQQSQQQPPQQLGLQQDLPIGELIVVKNGYQPNGVQPQQPQRWMNPQVKHNIFNMLRNRKPNPFAAKKV